MANTPKKIKDPTEAALSAIQDALQVRVDDPPKDHASAQSTPSTPPGETVAETPWPGLRSSQAADAELFAADRRPDDAAARPRPANDDRESIGQILRSLQRRAARTSYLLASIFAGVWILGGIGLGWLYLPELQAAFGPTGLTAPVLAVLALVYLAPVVFFYMLAHTAWRSQELRLIAQSMAEVAMRMAEPETVARESIVTVGQAIRREVAAMGDGVERALARAAELETLVANEVSALEHAYNDNEVRIRALLQDLGGQRDTLVSQAGQIRDAINSVHLDLGRDVSQISELVAEQVNEASQRITHALAEKSEHITRALEQAGETMIQRLGERSGDMLQRVESTSQRTEQAIAAVSERLTETLNFKTEAMIDRLDERGGDMLARLETTSQATAQAIATATDRVAETLDSKSDALLDRLDERGGDMLARLESTSQTTAQAIATASDRLTDTLNFKTDHIGEEFNE